MGKLIFLSKCSAEKLKSAVKPVNYVYVEQIFKIKLNQYSFPFLQVPDQCV